jgi:precorrin-2/cobalt-factor-2 C20-methyltransferase
MTASPGTLYGIGVGPGDPDLITVKALNVLRNVGHIFAASSTKNEYSLALEIVKRHLNSGTVERLPFPMTKVASVLEAAWEDNARRVLAVLEAGQDAAFVTLGDPLTYSTFGYLMQTVKRLAPRVPIIAIPGVTSYNAAAALSQIPLTEGEESLYVVSGALGPDRLKEAIHQTDNIVMLKVYRHFGAIYETIEELGLLDCATCVSRVGLNGEVVVYNLRALKDRDLPYLSLLIIKKPRQEG